ncbi:MAG TPA: recombinase family protein [Acidimicrobiales bacterium]|nr:recombinase family protein [Acidimicrobiales bacterium]
MTASNFHHKALIYIRVSTDGQLEKYGPDVQEAHCRAWCREHGLRVEGVYLDATSGENEAQDRDALSDALLALEERRAGTLVVGNLGRLARTLTVQEAALALAWSLDCEVVACDLGVVPRDDPDDPMRTFIRQVFGAVHQLDKAMIVKRLRDGRLRKHAAGGHAWGPHPYGSRDADQAAALARLVELRTAGQSYREVCAALTAEGHRPPRGGTWHPMTVRRLAEGAKLAS